MSSTITRFEIKPTLDQFYANGNQQTKVEIEVLKEEYQNGIPVKVPLSPSESASITVVAFSSNLGQTTMPTDWFVDTQRNNYDMGSFSRMIEGAQEVDVLQAELSAGCGDTDAAPAGGARTQRNNVPDVFSRYIRSRRIGTERLMARMVLDDGTVLTTNMSTGEYNFTSSVTLNAITPLSIQVSQLTQATETKQDQVYTSFNPDLHQTITAYFWTLPAGLRAESIIRSSTYFYNLGFDNGVAKDRFLTKGRSFLPGTTSANARDNVSGGCVQSYGYTMTVGSNQWAVSVLRTSGCSWTSSPNWGTVTFTIVDNYGNTHRFKVQPAGNQGDSVSISAA